MDIHPFQIGQPGSNWQKDLKFKIHVGIKFSQIFYIIVVFRKFFFVQTTDMTHVLLVMPTFSGRVEPILLLASLAPQEVMTSYPNKIAPEDSFSP